LADSPGRLADHVERIGGMADVDVHVCSVEALQRLLDLGATPRELMHHWERWGWQQQGRAVYLLAWREGWPVGRTTLTRASKYPTVRDTYRCLGEMNALEATPQGEGIGTAIIGAAEVTASAAGASWLGLAVCLDNVDAKALHERLGYTDWGRGEVIDEWNEPEGFGRPGRRHADPCNYLVKRLPTK
jgi:GNAT superfamily N-acetyltransferase